MPLSRDQVSLWAHATHPVACPLSETSVDAWVDRLQVATGGHVVDLGCGLGAWAGRLARRHPGIDVTAVDTSAVALAAARGAWPGSRVDWVHGDAVAWIEAHEAPVDAFLCSGSTHAFGGYRDALARLTSRLRPGGLLLVGEGFWTRAPASAALDALHASADDFLPLDETLGVAREQGYDVVHVDVSSDDEWDAYEAAWCAALEMRARTDRDLTDEDAQQLRELAHAHRLAYEEGYRGTLGYVTMLLRTPPEGR